MLQILVTEKQKLSTTTIIFQDNLERQIEICRGVNEDQYKKTFEEGNR